LLAPVQQLDYSYVAAVQPQGSAYGVLISAPITSQQLKPLLDSDQQLALPSKLHSLHVLQPAQPSGGGKPGSAVAAVVLADGTVAAADFKQAGLHAAASSSSAAAASSGQQRSSTQRLLHAACSGELLAVAKQQSGQHAAVDVYCANNSSTSSNDDAALQLQQNSLQLVHSCSVPPPSAGSKLAGVSVAGGVLVLLWSCHTVSVCRSRQSSPVNTMRLPPALAAALAAAGQEEVNPAERSASKRKQRPAAATSGSDWTAAALSEQHVLLLAVHGGAGSTQVQYALLDSSYGSCLSSGSFTAGSGSISGRLQLLPLPQHPFAPVALLVAGAVWLLPLQLPKADLAGLVSNLGLGSMQAHAAAAAVTPIGTQLLLTSRQQLNLSAIAAAVSNGSEGLQQQQQGPSVLQQLQPQPAAAEGDVPAAVQQVQQVLNKQKRPAQELQDATTQLCTALEQQQQGQASAAVLVSQQLLSQALSALAEAQEWDLLDRLHNLAPLQSLAACADVVPALAAGEQYSRMRKVLLAAQDIPAEAVVRAVQQVLQAQQQQGDASGPQQAAAQQIRAAAEAVVQQAEAAAAAGPSDDTAQLVAAARHAAAAVDGFTSRELLLHGLLSVQVDGVEAQAVLRALPAAAVLRLLRYMVKWLHKYSRNNMSCPSTDPLLCAPAAAQVVEWCKLLLDAQLTKLLMMPVAAPLLQQLQQRLRAEVAATSKLVALKGVTDTWASGAPLPAAAVAANSQYVLELLDLRVKPLAAGARGK
jgi:hypothetical protein